MVYSVELSGSLSITLAYTHASEVETTKVWKTQKTVVYAVELSSSLSITLAYIHTSEEETNKV